MRLRSPVPSDAAGVLEVILARDRADFGVPDFTLADLRDEWGQSEFDLAADAVVCETSHSAIVAYAAVRRVGSLAIVAPDHEGRGIGRRLLEWVHERERALDRDRDRQAIASTNVRGEQLLRGAGYNLTVCYFRMACELAGATRHAVMPAGVSLRVPERGRDARDLYTLDAEAFAESADYVPMTFTAFCEEHLDAHDHAAELSSVAERGGELVGFVLARRWESVGYVDILAVRPGNQRQGIGSAMLKTALERFASAGLREAQLGVASTNPGALNLYERTGMRRRFQVNIYERRSVRFPGVASSRADSSQSPPATCRPAGVGRLIREDSSQHRPQIFDEVSIGEEEEPCPTESPTSSSSGETTLGSPT